VDSYLPFKELTGVISYKQSSPVPFRILGTWWTFNNLGWMEGWRDGWMDGRVNGRVDEWIGRWIDG
jgi:hypothetical protein